MAKKVTRGGVNYDDVSRTYDERYQIAYKPEGIAFALSELARKIRAERILEIGCGTGHWLAILEMLVAGVYGMDRSPGMLQKAAERKGNFQLIRGDVDRLPFHNGLFDMVFCVNALHHFSNPSQFIFDAGRLLKNGGALSIIGMDPHAGRDRWFLYDYFAGTYEADLERYPSAATIAEWMKNAGLKNAACHVAERIEIIRKGRELLPVNKESTSQLILLTPRAYAEGVAKIETAIAKAEASGEEQDFITDISLFMTTGWVEEQNR